MTSLLTNRWDKHNDESSEHWNAVSDSATSKYLYIKIDFKITFNFVKKINIKLATWNWRCYNISH